MDQTREQTSPPPSEAQKTPFEKQKTQYFFKLGLSMRKALEVHKASGLWNREDDWRNVTRHCLAQAARATEFAKVLGLSPQIQVDAALGATLHDVGKKREITGARGADKANTSVWKAFENARKKKNGQLQRAGFSQDVIRLSNAAPYGSIPQTEELLQKDDLNEYDIAYLMLHYIDDISINDTWVDPAEIVDGVKIDQLDRRLTTGNNPIYKKLDEEGKKHFEGESTWHAAKRVGHMLEERLATMVSEKTGNPLDPKDLPTFIDGRVKAAITSAS